MTEHFLERTADLKAVENGIKNKFRWQWLEEKDCNGDYLSDFVRKLSKPGLAFCVFCDQRLDYSKKGKCHLKRHAESEGHKRCRNAVKSTQALPAVFQATSRLERGENPTVENPSLPYGAAPNVVECQRFSLQFPVASKGRGPKLKVFNL